MSFYPYSGSSLAHGDEAEKLHTAPEGLPQFRDLLEKSTEIGKELRESGFDYLQGLAEAWCRLDLRLAGVGALIKSWDAISNDTFTEMLLGCLSPDVLKKIFLYDPEMNGGWRNNAELLRDWETQINKMWKPESRRMRSNLYAFWKQWRLAKQELRDKGLEIRKRYAAFRLGNRLYQDVKFPIEPNRFGEASVSLLDAITIVSGLLNLDPTTEGEEKSFESQSVEKLVEFVIHRAAQGHQPKDPLANDEIKIEVVTSAASAAESTAVGEVRSLEALG